MESYYLLWNACRICKRLRLWRTVRLTWRWFLVLTSDRHCHISYTWSHVWLSLHLLWWHSISSSFHTKYSDNFIRWLCRYCAHLDLLGRWHSYLKRSQQLASQHRFRDKHAERPRSVRRNNDCWLHSYNQRCHSLDARVNIVHLHTLHHDLYEHTAHLTNLCDTNILRNRSICELWRTCLYCRCLMPINDVLHELNFD